MPLEPAFEGSLNSHRDIITLDEAGPSDLVCHSGVETSENQSLVQATTCHDLKDKRWEDHTIRNSVS